MGCHTWFYKKSDLPLDECIKKVKKQIRDGLNWSNIYLLDISGHVELDGGGNQPFKENELNDWIRYNTRILSWLEKGWIRESAYNLLTDAGMYFRGNYYVDTNEFHDVFRIHNYPDDVLLSMDETVEFLQKNNIVMDEYISERLKLFWNKYPDGQIHFG